MAPPGLEPGLPLSGTRILSPLRLPFRHGPDEADSTGDAAILEAVRKKDWERLGVLLGVHDRDLGILVTAWPKLSRQMREAINTLASHTLRHHES